MRVGVNSLLRKLHVCFREKDARKQSHQRLEKCCLLKPETAILEDEMPEGQRYTVPGEAILSRCEAHV